MNVKDLINILLTMPADFEVRTAGSTYLGCDGGGSDYEHWSKPLKKDRIVKEDGKVMIYVGTT